MLTLMLDEPCKLVSYSRSFANFLAVITFLHRTIISNFAIGVGTSRHVILLAASCSSVKFSCSRWMISSLDASRRVLGKTGLFLPQNWDFSNFQFLLSFSWTIFISTAAALSIGSNIPANGGFCEIAMCLIPSYLRFTERMQTLKIRRNIFWDNLLCGWFLC